MTDYLQIVPEVAPLDCIGLYAKSLRCVAVTPFPPDSPLGAAMAQRQAKSLGTAALTASALANASQLCPIPAVQTLFRLAALALDISSVRAQLTFPCTDSSAFNDILRALKTQPIMCNSLRVTLARSF